MDMNVLNKVLWWIPNKKCRDFVRDYFNKVIDIDNKIDILINMNAGVAFKSQYRQDIDAYIYFKSLRKNPSDCFYVDIGAYDGINISNSYVFEELGWDGICVEANPRIFDKLKQNRKCDAYNVAITDETNSSVDFVDVENIIVISGLQNDMTKEHFDRIKREGGKINHIKVPTMSFDDLMKNHKRTHIDFLSLDVEGAELTILKSIDFSKYTFSLITIENNEPDNVLVDFMNEKGYKEYKRLGCDIMFIPKIL